MAGLECSLKFLCELQTLLRQLVCARSWGFVQNGIPSKVSIFQRSVYMLLQQSNTIEHMHIYHGWLFIFDFPGPSLG
jgi:hypothetical protein